MSTTTEQWKELGKAIENFKVAAEASMLLSALVKANEAMARIAKQIGPYSEEELAFREKLGRRQRIKTAIAYACVVIVIIAVMMALLLMI